MTWKVTAALPGPASETEPFSPNSLRFFLPGRNQIHDHHQYHKWQSHNHSRYDNTIDAKNRRNIAGEPSETLGYQLSADDHIPAHGENPDQYHGRSQKS